MLTIAAVTMMHNEQDVCVQVVRHMLAQGVDAIVVADNLSTDETRRLLTDAFAEDDRVRLIEDAEPTYHQGEKMTRLAHLAHKVSGADWIVPFDADELWTGAFHLTLREALAIVDRSGADSSTADKWEMVPHPDDDECDPDPFSRIRHCERAVMPSYKTAFRWTARTRIGAGNHRVSTQGMCAERALTLRHYSHRSYEQARAKYLHGAASLPASWPPEWGAHWRDRGSMSEEAFAQWWAAATDPAGLVLWPATRAVRPTLPLTSGADVP